MTMNELDNVPTVGRSDFQRLVATHGNAEAEEIPLPPLKTTQGWQIRSRAGRCFVRDKNDRIAAALNRGQA